MLKILFTILVMTSTVYAGSSVTKNWAMPSPPVDDNTAQYDFLNFLYIHFNQAQIVTVSPNGNVRGKAGNFILYNNSGTHQVCFQTAQPSGTTWKCANLT